MIAITPEPQSPITVSPRTDYVEVAIVSGLPGPAGPAGPAGADGAAGESVNVYQGNATPTAEREGDLWMKPVALEDGSPGVQLNAWDGTAWKPVSGGAGGVAAGTVDTTGNQVGIPQSPDLPLQEWAAEVMKRGAWQDYGVNFSRLTCLAPGWAPGDPSADGVVFANGAFVGELFYGGLFGRDGRADFVGYQLPTPTGDGYLRCDQDPTTGWYFAEPVIVSDTEPPAPAGGGAIWIDPTAGDTQPVGVFAKASPMVYADAPATEQSSGQPIGLSPDGMTFHQPDIVGGIPIMVNGRRYMLPIIEE